MKPSKPYGYAGIGGDRLVRLMLPFWYLFKTRLIPLQDRISWVLIQPIAQGLIIALYVESVTWPHLIVAVLAMIAWQVGYELGYMQNDTYTADRESDPTLRLDPCLDRALRDGFRTVVTVRMTLALLLLGGIWSVHVVTGVPINLWLYIAVGVGGVSAFVVHNILRGRWNIGTYFVLCFSRYAAVPLLLVPNESLVEVAVVTFFMMALPRSLEHAAKPKFGIQSVEPLLGRFHEIRVIYYASTSALCAVLVMQGYLGVAAVLVFVYYLLLRLVVLLAKNAGWVTPSERRAYKSLRFR